MREPVDDRVRAHISGGGATPVRPVDGFGVSAAAPVHAPSARVGDAADLLHLVVHQWSGYRAAWRSQAPFGSMKRRRLMPWRTSHLPTVATGDGVARVLKLAGDAAGRPFPLPTNYLDLGDQVPGRRWPAGGAGRWRGLAARLHRRSGTGSPTSTDTGERYRPLRRRARSVMLAPLNEP